MVSKGEPPLEILFRTLTLGGDASHSFPSLHRTTSSHLDHAHDGTSGWIGTWPSLWEGDQSMGPRSIQSFGGSGLEAGSYPAWKTIPSLRRQLLTLHTL